MDLPRLGELLASPSEGAQQGMWAKLLRNRRFGSFKPSVLLQLLVVRGRSLR
jgi:hypothetical protein